MHCGPQWAAAPEGQLVLLLRSDLSPSERAVWWGRREPPDAAVRVPEQRRAPRSPTIQCDLSASPRPGRGLHAPRPSSAGLRSRCGAGRPDPRAGWAGVLRARWRRGVSDSCSSQTDWLARTHPARGHRSRSPRARSEAGTGHPVLDLLIPGFPENTVYQPNSHCADGGDRDRGGPRSRLLGGHGPPSPGGALTSPGPFPGVSLSP